jgi:TetR/AcrR family transcriptional regulator, cholesterol catabolism regulator
MTTIDGRRGTISRTSRIAHRRETMANGGGDAYKARRRAVVETAAHVFREKGYQAASINDIARELGTDRASIYYYIGSKEELLVEVVNVVVDEIYRVAVRIATMKSNPKERLSAIIREMVASYDRNYPFMYVYIEDMARIAYWDVPWAKETVQKAQRFEAVVQDLLREGASWGVFREDVPMELADFSLFGMINWTHRWYKPGGRYSPTEVANAFCTIFFDGFGKRNASDAGDSLVAGEGKEEPRQ